MLKKIFYYLGLVIIFGISVFMIISGISILHNTYEATTGIITIAVGAILLTWAILFVAGAFSHLKK